VLGKKPTRYREGMQKPTQSLHLKSTEGKYSLKAYTNLKEVCLDLYIISACNGRGSIPLENTARCPAPHRR